MPKKTNTTGTAVAVQPESRVAVSASGAEVETVPVEVQEFRDTAGDLIEYLTQSQILGARPVNITLEQDGTRRILAEGVPSSQARSAAVAELKSRGLELSTQMRNALAAEGSKLTIFGEGDACIKVEACYEPEAWALARQNLAMSALRTKKRREAKAALLAGQQ